MNTFQDGLKMLDEQDEIIRAAQAEKKRIAEELAKKFCPVGINDVVTVNFGYSYEGKQIKVDRVAFRRKSWSNDDGFVATGKVLRKDGSEGSNRAEHFAKPA